MLVLTRKRAQTIRIGEDVVIKVIRTGRNAVKIGIQAPENVRVLRGELCFEQGEKKGTVVEMTSMDDDDEEMLAGCTISNMRSAGH
jgi:carbon storage regulator